MYPVKIVNTSLTHAPPDNKQSLGPVTEIIRHQSHI